MARRLVMMLAILATLLFMVISLPWWMIFGWPVLFFKWLIFDKSVDPELVLWPIAGPITFLADWDYIND